MAYKTAEQKKEYDRLRWEKIKADPNAYIEHQFQWKKYHLKSKYGLSYEEYLNLKHKQDNLCLICKISEAVVVDHCHTTNEIRGMLCQPCNQGIGHLKDNPIFCRNAAEYLEVFEDKQLKNLAVVN